MMSIKKCALIFFLALFIAITISADETSDSTSSLDTASTWECPDYGPGDPNAVGYTGYLTAIVDSLGAIFKYDIGLRTNWFESSVSPYARLDATADGDTVEITIRAIPLESVEMDVIAPQGYSGSFQTSFELFYLRLLSKNDLYRVSVVSDTVLLEKIKEESVCLSQTVGRVSREKTSRR